jgi:transcriptional regulator with XRE-family HTH domain
VNNHISHILKFHLPTFIFEPHHLRFKVAAMQRVDPDTFPDIGRRLRLLRTAVMPTGNPAEFARSVGLTRTAWMRCEIGAARLGLTTALLLRQKFGVSLDWIYVGDESMMPQQLMMKIAELEQNERAPSTNRA